MCAHPTEGQQHRSTGSLFSKMVSENYRRSSIKNPIPLFDFFKKPDALKRKT